MTRYQLAALVGDLGYLLGVLATAAPEDKAEVYRKLGLQLTYDPARRVVTIESYLGPEGSGAHEAHGHKAGQRPALSKHQAPRPWAKVSVGGGT